MYHIRLLNKRNKQAVYPDDLLIFDIDRSCPLMGNPIPLEDKDDDDMRDSVLLEYREYFQKEYAGNPAFRQRIQYFADLVKSGKKLGLRCWCHPKKCHGNVIIEKINQLVKKPMAQSIEAKAVPEFLRERFAPEDVDYTECRFVVHMPRRPGNTKWNDHDWHMVKEIVHLKDGRSVPNIRYIEDYKRKYWVTAPRFRKSYTQKREWETLDRLIEGESIESDLPLNVARSLGQLHLAKQFFALKDSPYLYGADIPSTVSVKHDYFEKMGDKPHTPFKTAYSDTETNMLGLDNGASKYILMQSLYFEGKLYTVVLKDFLKTVPRPRETLQELFDEHMPQQGKDLVKEWVLDIVDQPIDIVKLIMKKAHEWQPDFMSFWNLIFDLDKMIECVEEAGYRPEDIFCDPKLPPDLRYFYLKRANPNKTSASGRTMTKKPADQWHTAFMPASFYLVDQMATYRFIRKSKQLEPSYGLDEILGKELKGLGKLKHKPAEGLNKAEFHIFMQQRYPGEYVIYHLWDVVCQPVLDAKIQDLGYSLPGTTEYSDFVSFESEPKRYVHKFHHYILKNHNAVTGVSGKTLVQEYDEMTISTKGHIVTLEPHLTVDTGMKIFKDYPGIQTNFYGHNADLDVKSSYPYGQWVFNMSRQTTVRELIDIEGVRDSQRRIQGLNISGGRSNAVEFCTEIFKVPTLADLGDIFDKAKANPAQ
jgi:hypothetical protein